MDIGSAVRELRKAKGLSQRELAEASGLTQATVSQMESGKKRPRESNLKRICDCLGLPVPALSLYAMEVSDLPEAKREAFGKVLMQCRALMIGMFEG
jgi:transcriptional regulator with XRE-family HTH domain